MASLISLIFEGDSTTDSGGIYYPMLAAGIANNQVPGYGAFESQSSGFWLFKNGDVICINRAVGGSRLHQTVAPTGDGSGRDIDNLTSNGIQDRFSTWVQPLVQKSIGNPPLSKWDNARPARKYIFSLMVGTNPNDGNPNNLAADVATFIGTVRSAGFDKVILCPLLSRTDGIITNFDTVYMEPYNAIITGSTWQQNNGVDAVPRWDQEPLLCGTGAANSATYFQDKIHPTQIGAALMYPYFQTALNSVVSTL